MSKTIEQIQAMITGKADVREVINELADYLQANPGGGSGGGGSSYFENYQNSAMSEAVMAYVYRDEGDNIYRVYEPIRNNDVSRSQFAYADSIDLFPFDNVGTYNNFVTDLKLINPDGLVIKNSNIKNVTIDFNTFSGLEITECNLFNSTDQGSDILLSGDNITLNLITTSGFFIIEEMGEGSTIEIVNMDNGAGIFCQGHQLLIQNLKLGIQSDLFLEVDTNTHDIYLGNQSNYKIRGGTTNMYIGNNSNVGITDTGFVFTALGGILKDGASLNAGAGSLECSGFIIGDNCSVTPTTSITAKNFINVGGTTYELGEDTGAATLTAV